LIFGLTIVFVFVRLGPIDPARAIAGPQSSQSVPQIREQLGLNEPLWQQYIDYIWNLLTFDLGQSWVIFRAGNVYDLIGIFAPRTIWLGFWSVLIAIFVGIPLGFYAGLNPNAHAVARGVSVAVPLAGDPRTGVSGIGGRMDRCRRELRPAPDRNHAKTHATVRGRLPADLRFVDAR
jgi:ABC-type dipeptide/oligopeptide/nickel transport system permease component